MCIRDRAVAPSDLWIDEIEKGLGRVEGAGDSGTSARIFATFLTWMQEKTKPVFVIATANDISKLPPELLRKGRFDEIFFVDLPTEIERKNIFKVHLKKRVEKAEISEDIEINEELLESLSKDVYKRQDGIYGFIYGRDFLYRHHGV